MKLLRSASPSTIVCCISLTMFSPAELVVSSVAQEPGGAPKEAKSDHFTMVGKKAPSLVTPIAMSWSLKDRSTRHR